MNDILKYYPITVTYNGRKVSVPMGDIAAIEQRQNHCVIHTKGTESGGDTWTTEESYDDVMAQWKKAFNSLGSGLYL